MFVVWSSIPPTSLGKLEKSSQFARRIDFLYTPPNEYPFAILYFTGSKGFNTAMRQRALDIGYSLNEHGIYEMKHGIKGKKLNMVFETEQDIFDFLNMQYKKPEERIDGRSVVLNPIIESLFNRHVDFFFIKAFR